MGSLIREASAFISVTAGKKAKHKMPVAPAGRIP